MSKVCIDLNSVLELRNKGLSLNKIAPMFNTHRRALAEFLRESGVEVGNIRYKYTEVDWDKAIKEYESGKSLTTIASNQNVKYDVVRKYFIDNNIPIRTVHESRHFTRKYRHKNIFKPLTKRGAYLLGWILSDGTVSKSNRNFAIGISKKDKIHLMYLRFLVTNTPLSEGDHYFRFTVSDKLIYNSLDNLGVRPRKSFTNYDINWELIREEHYPYLILGLFEGDGSIAKDQSSVSMLLPSKLYKSINTKILKPNSIKSRPVPIKLNDYGLLNVYFSGKDYYNFCSYMYSNTPLVKPLKRKKRRYIKRLETVANSKSTYREIAIKHYKGIV